MMISGTEVRYYPSAFSSLITRPLQQFRTR